MKFCFFQLADSKLLCLCGKTAAQSEFTERTDLVSAAGIFDLPFQTFPETGIKPIIIVRHTEIHFVNNRQCRDLIQGRIQPGTECLDGKSAFRLIRNLKILIARLPQAQEINIASLDPCNAVQIFQLFLRKTQTAVCLNLLFDLLHHLCRKVHIGIAALECPCGFIVGELVIDGLSHTKFVHVCFQQTGDDLI